MNFWKKHRKVLVTVAVVLVLLGGLGWGGHAAWQHHNYVEARERAKELTDKMFSEGPKAFQNTSAEQRQEMRSTLRKLTDDDRRDLFQSAMKKEFARYAQMSKKEKTAFLDQRIDQLVKMRKQFDKRRADRAKAGNAGQDPGVGTSGAGGRRGPLTQEQRDERTKAMFSRIPPETREAMFTLRKDMQQRMQQRGITMPMGGGRGL